MFLIHRLIFDLSIYACEKMQRWKTFFQKHPQFFQHSSWRSRKCLWHLCVAKWLNKGNQMNHCEHKTWTQMWAFCSGWKAWYEGTTAVQRLISFIIVPRSEALEPGQNLEKMGWQKSLHESLDVIGLQAAVSPLASGQTSISQYSSAQSDCRLQTFHSDSDTCTRNCRERSPLAMFVLLLTNSTINI